MRFFIPLCLAVILLGGGFGLTFLHKYVNSPESKFTLDGDNSDVSPLGAAFRMMFEDATGATTTTPELDIAGILPEARPGWFRKEYVNTDGEALTGREIIHSAVIKSDSNSMLLRFETDAKNKRGHHAYTYMRGELRVIVRARILEQLNRDTIRGDMLGTVADNMADAMVGLEEPSPERRFAKMDGVAFTQEAPFNYIRLERRGVPTDYRVFNGYFGKLVHIQIMTNASDNAVAETIKGLDIASLLEQIGQPERASGFTTNLAEPLSQQRPDITPGQAAFALLQTDHGLAENEVRNMRKISSGDIETAEQLRQTVGSGANLSPAFQAFLAENTFPPEVIVDDEVDRQKEAADLIKFLPRASPSEFVLLHMIRTGEVETYADAARVFPHIATKSRRILGLLEGYDPQAAAGTVQKARADRTIYDTQGRGEAQTVRLDPPAAQAPPAGQAAKPVVRRFTGSSGLSTLGSCNIVDGVRRCVLDGQ